MLGRIVTILPLTLLLTLLVIGKRPLAELPVFDFLVIIAMGVTVGAGIADLTGGRRLLRPAGCHGS